MSDTSTQNVSASNASTSASDDAPLWLALGPGTSFRLVSEPQHIASLRYTTQQVSQCVAELVSLLWIAVSAQCVIS